MSIKFSLNRNIDVTKIDDHNVIITNNLNDKILQMTNMEFEVIKKYSDINDINFCYEFFKKKNKDIDIKWIFTIISIAKRYHLLTLDPDNVNTKFSYLAYFLNIFYPYFVISTEKIRKKNTIQIFSIYFQNKVNAIYLLGIIFILCILLYVPFVIFQNSELFLTKYIFCFILFIIISTFIHELSHLLMYRVYGGRNGKIAFGVLYKIYPIFYCTNLVLINISNKQKAIIGIIGIFIDIIVFFITIHAGADKFFIFIALYKFIFNINPLIYNTDGFYVIKDIFGISMLYFTKKKSVNINFKSFI